MGFHEYFYFPFLNIKRRHLSGIEHFKTGKDQYNCKLEEHNICGALPNVVFDEVVYQEL